MVITLAEAEEVLRAAKAKAAEMGIRVSIVVVDPRGDLVAVVRMDAARFLTFDVAHGKAFAAAAFGRPGREMMERADSPALRSLILMQGGHLIFSKGGVPLKRGEEVIGAVGASGGTADQDEEVCQAGAAAL